MKMRKRCISLFLPTDDSRQNEGDALSRRPRLRREAGGGRLPPAGSRFLKEVVERHLLIDVVIQREADGALRPCHLGLDHIADKVEQTSAGKGKVETGRVDLSGRRYNK